MSLFESERFFDTILFESFGKHIPVLSYRLVAAGSLNQGIFIQTQDNNFFLKTNFSEFHDIFDFEARSLQDISKATFLKVPEVFQTGSYQGQNYLLMEWIDSKSRQSSFWEGLGEGLAQLHMNTQSSFGLYSDNYIASLPQLNKKSNSWAEFFVDNRLDPLAGKAYYEGYFTLDFYKKFQKIYPLINQLIPTERPAFLHGDLWSGNVLVDDQGKPCLIDPATYYGHREMDIAFSKLFGGFDPVFYQVYEEVFPLEPDFDERMDIHNLYPLLVHVLLFGESYVAGISKTLIKYLG